MATIEIGTEQLIDGRWTVAELNNAFERVQNKDHWKGPINKVLSGVDPDELDLIAAAVEFYTATKARITMAGVGTYRITADGYWAGPAGDH